MTKSFVYWMICLLSVPLIAEGRQSTTDAPYFFSDLEDYLTAPARWDNNDWLMLGAFTGGIVIISETVDDTWKQEMISEDHPNYYDYVARIGNAWGNGALSGPFMLGVYGYGYWNNDSEYMNAGYSMLQAGAYTALATTVLKVAFHRDRPNEALDEAGWFQDGRSFPSGHTSFAFAVSRSFLNSLQSPSTATKILFYGLATSTAFARTIDNKHWVSDVVAGALLGIYTADFVRDQQARRRGSVVYAPYIDANTVGIQLAW